MKKRLLIISSMVALAMVAGVASAWWTTGGGGSDDTQSIDAEFPLDLDVTSEQNALDASTLHPGGDIELDVTVTNPNEGSAFFSGVSGAVTSGSAACDAYLHIDDITDWDETLAPSGALGDSSTETTTLTMDD